MVLFEKSVDLVTASFTPVPNCSKCHMYLTESGKDAWGIQPQSREQWCMRGAGIVQWLEHWTCDWRVPGSSPGRSSGRIFFSRVSFLCWLLFQYMLHPSVTTVKNPCLSAKSVSGRLQLDTHTPYLCGFEWSDTVNWCMVKWCTQNLRWDGSSFTWHQPCNNQRALSAHHFDGY